MHSVQLIFDGTPWTTQYWFTLLTYLIFSYLVIVAFPAVEHMVTKSILYDSTNLFPMKKILCHAHQVPWTDSCNFQRSTTWTTYSVVCPSNSLPLNKGYHWLHTMAHCVRFLRTMIHPYHRPSNWQNPKPYNASIMRNHCKQLFQ